MTAHEALIAYMRKHEYSGLFNSFVPCGCGIEDLAPCGDMTDECVLAYRWYCDACDIRETCELRDEFDNIDHCFRDKKPGGDS